MDARLEPVLSLGRQEAMNADRAHKITVELAPHELPPARPHWHEMLVDALIAVRRTGDLTATGAARILELVGISEPRAEREKDRAA